MKLPDLGIVIAGSEPHMSISAAIEAAEKAPGAMVWIPASYTGTDVATPTTVPVVDCRYNYSSFSSGLPSLIDEGTF